MQISTQSVKSAGTFAGLCAVGGFLYKLFTDYGERQAGLLTLDPIAPNVSKLPGLAAVLYDFQQYREYGETYYLELNGCMERLAYEMHELQKKSDDMEHSLKCVRWMYAYASAALDCAVAWIKSAPSSVAGSLRVMYDEDLFTVLNTIVSNGVAIGMERGHVIPQSDRNRKILDRQRGDK